MNSDVARRLRHVINELAARLSDAERDTPEVRELISYGCQTRMHVAQLLATQLDYDDHTKDVDFSAAGIEQRWGAGYAHTKAVLAPALGRPVRSAIRRDPT